jgi:oxaloacetate decarboxylase gamma subunit
LKFVEGELLEQGLALMLAGMGTVFVFLTLLVFATTGMSALVRRFEPAPIAESSGPTEEEVAAITAAITLHRSKHSK